MNNTGTGLVIASLALADHTQVILAIIFCNLIQYLMATAVYSRQGPKLPKQNKTLKFSLTRF
jgi:hypothetical protein